MTEKQIKRNSLEFQQLISDSNKNKPNSYSHVDIDWDDTVLTKENGKRSMLVYKSYESCDKWKYEVEKNNYKFYVCEQQCRNDCSCNGQENHCWDLILGSSSGCKRRRKQILKLKTKFEGQDELVSGATYQIMLCNNLTSQGQDYVILSSDAKIEKTVQPASVNSDIKNFNKFIIQIQNF